MIVGSWEMNDVSDANKHQPLGSMELMPVARDPHGMWREFSAVSDYWIQNRSLSAPICSPGRRLCRARLATILVVLISGGYYPSLSLNTSPGFCSAVTGGGKRLEIYPNRRSYSLESSIHLKAFESDLYYETDSASITDDGQVDSIDQEVDIAIVGSGLGGLCAGAVLNSLYGFKVGVYESHYLPGGCAHAFQRRAPNGMSFTFDSGPTILLGCSSPPFNALQQVLQAIDQPVEWLPYSGWGMIENPGQPGKELRWRVDLGPDFFQNGPLQRFGGPKAQEEFREIREITKPLLAGSAIPAMAMRGAGPSALVPLLRYFPTLWSLLKAGEATTGTFAPYMDGPVFTVSDPWLRNWLDALAFSLSGLPASRTSAAAMSFVLNDMHRSGAALDYPRGGLGSVVDALVRGVEQGAQGSRVHLRQHVSSIDFSGDGRKTIGVTLRSGKKIAARHGVICNAPVWSFRDLIESEEALKKLGATSAGSRDHRSSWRTTSEGSSIHHSRSSASIQPDPLTEKSMLKDIDDIEMTGSFLHLHLALNATGLNLNDLEAHYTVMDRSLNGNSSLVVNDVQDGPCGELNMIAVSNPCVLDKSLAPDGFIVVHAYGAGNEPFELWERKDGELSRTEYLRMKERRAEALWRAVESVIPDARARAVLSLSGSPLTHERFLRRNRGTYGSATEDYLPDGSTPFSNLWIANDQVFPGIGVPAVAIAGASAANAMVDVLRHWRCLDKLDQAGKLNIIG
jgi:phytoene dehydrogenase-like protein